MPATDPAVYDHLRPNEADVDPGVYRVVGTPDETVTLLRVGDANGRRVNTGAVVQIDRAALAGFEPADNPDGNRSASENVGGFLSDFGWQIRTFVGDLRANPVASLVAVALLVVGNQGDRLLSGPDPAFTAVYFLGVFALVYLGARGS
jgi:hypothetical protein